MFNPSAFLIRPAGDTDEPTIAWLSTMCGCPLLRRPALIGHIDGMPAAAISLIDGAVIADPFQPTAELVMHLRLHRSGWRGTGARTSIAARVRTAITFAVRPAPQA
jgi:hypothetical protein